MTAPQVAEAVFDSHRFVKRLTEAGMERELAEVLAEEHMGPWIRNVATKADIENFRSEAATKTDMELVRRDLADTEANIRRDIATKTDVEAVREDLANFRANAPSKKDLGDLRAETASKKDLEHAVKVARLELEKRLAELRGDLIKWMFGALMAQGALVVAIIKLLS